MSWTKLRTTQAGTAVEASRRSVRPCLLRRRNHKLAVAAQGETRESWEFGRFLRTVLFFNPPPSPQSLVASVSRILRPKEQSGPNGSSLSGEWVLVTGSTGGVGSRVVQQLLAEGQNVRALARDRRKAEQLLAGGGVSAPGKLEIVTGDISQAETLQASYFQGVHAIISATAATVAPKEGDTPERGKYRQGIKFYEPEVLGLSPEAVEFRGLVNLLKAAKQSNLIAGNVLVFDSQQKCPAAEWGPLDDVVMGGVSESSLTRSSTGSEAIFSGRVSAANSGGFASVRTRNFEPPLDLSACDALRLRVKGDGLRYKATLRTDTYWDGVGYTQSFDTRAGEWQNVDLAFDAFVPVFRAKSKPDAAPLDAANVVSLQLMLSKFEYDGQLNPRFKLGEFSLPIARVEGVVRGGRPGPSVAKFVHVSSAGVTRPGRPGLDLDKEPPAVRMNEELGGLLTWKLAGEDAIRESGTPFTIVRPVALTEEPAGAELEIAQGDNMTGKISRSEIAQLCVALLREPAARNMTFEIRSKVPFSTAFEIDTDNPPALRDWGALVRAAGLREGVTGKAQRIEPGDQASSEAIPVS